jgi:hypothetical protein
MPVATLDFDSGTEARQPYLGERDRVEIVEKATSARRWLTQPSPNARFAWEAPSGPSSDGDLQELARAFEFIKVENVQVTFNSSLHSGSEPVALKGVEDGLKVQQVLPGISADADLREDAVDGDVRITTPPPRSTRTIKLHFVQAGPRAPRIRTNPLD